MRQMVKAAGKFALFISLLLAMQLVIPVNGNAYTSQPGAGDAVQDNVVINDEVPDLGSIPVKSFKAVAKDKRVFITAGIKGLFILNTENPESPLQESYIPLPEAVSQVEISGGYLYLPAANKIYIFDISNVQNPVYTWVNRMYPDGACVDISADADRIYIAGSKTITAVSARTPGKLEFLAIFSPDNADENFTITGLAARGNTVYAVMKDKGIRIFDFSSPNDVKSAGYYYSAAGDITRVVLEGDKAYACIPGKSSIEVLGITDINKPKYEKTIEGVTDMLYIREGAVYTAVDMKPIKLEQEKELTAPAVEEPVTEQIKPLKTAYITIDDGPAKTITDTNLDTLKKYGIKATFFVLPHSGMKDTYKRILEEGHVIGNHSYSHDYSKLYSDTDYFKADVLKAREYIYDMLGYTTVLFRFPGGAMGKDKDMIKERADILKELGYTYYEWHVSTADTSAAVLSLKDDEAVKAVTDNVLKYTRGREKLIVLMHDSRGKMSTARALPQIIEGLMEQGYGFDVLSNY